MSNIIVYTTKTCAFCKEVVRFLGHKNKKYTLKDVTEDIETRKWLYEMTGYQTVPVTQVGDKFVVGPQLGKIAELLQ